MFSGLPGIYIISFLVLANITELFLYYYLMIKGGGGGGGVGWGVFIKISSNSTF